jgi:hypothetical protein
MQHDTPATERPRFRPRPWTSLDSVEAVELWIDEHNRAMQELIRPEEQAGAGIRFSLVHGGDLLMQTRGDAILLDLEPDAAWITPLLEAITGQEAPRGQMWAVPEDRLIQLILGLDSLVQSTTLVVGHRFSRAPMR